MNAMTTAEDSAELRVLQDGELDGVSGAKATVCITNTTSIFTEKGIFVVGTDTCDGVVIPVADWIPLR